MTPTREWLTRGQIEDLVDEKVGKMFEIQKRDIDQRLAAQDKILAEIKAIQHANHEENRKRLDKADHDLKNILQYHTTDQELRKVRQNEQDERDKRWDRWKNRLTIVGILVTVFSSLGIFNYLHRWFLSGHLFTPVH